MTKCHSSQEVISRAIRSSCWPPEDAAAAILSDLRTAGYIIVEKGAIGRAQREAVAAYREDATAAVGRISAP